MATSVRDRLVPVDNEERIRASISQIVTLLNRGTNKVQTLRAILPYASFVLRGHRLQIEPHGNNPHQALLKQHQLNTTRNLNHQNKASST